jgi:hypothetical protein
VPRQDRRGCSYLDAGNHRRCAGTVTAITTPTAYQSDRGIQLASRIANGTGFTVRCKQRENVVTADYFTSASIPAITATGTTTTSLTLTGDDMKTFGSLVQGRPAFSWVPMASGAKGQNLNANRMEVADISIKNVVVGEQTLTSSTSVARINQTPALIRVKGKMKIEDSDFTSAAAAGTVTELECADTTLKSKVAMRNINPTSPAQPANVTPPASGAAYINLDAYPQDIVWSGGTRDDAIRRSEHRRRHDVGAGVVRERWRGSDLSAW